jgi:hypothetical protein
MKSSPRFDGEVLAVLPAEMAKRIAQLPPERLKLMVPRHWKSGLNINKNAQRVEDATLDWFLELGCSQSQLRRVRKFRPSLYMGIPFPLAGYKEALLISKYLSLWLLWDDVDIESQGSSWKLSAYHVLSGEIPASATLFDVGWWKLLRELSETMSPQWIDQLCHAMATWSDAALREARLSKQWNTGARVTLAEALQSRIDTIGMYTTAQLVEYAIGFELPKSFHDHEAVRRIKIIAGKIVGLGNDMFSLAKDCSNDYINVISALRRERSISTVDALRTVAEMHNGALIEYDILARSLPTFGPAYDPLVAKWLKWLRHSCIGFSVWESVAPRYSELKLLVNGRMVEISFVYDREEAWRTALSPDGAPQFDVLKPLGPDAACAVRRAIDRVEPETNAHVFAGGLLPFVLVETCWQAS